MGKKDVPLKNQLEQENAQGVTCYKLGEYHKALAHFQKGLAHSLTLYPEKKHASVAKCYHNLASTYMKLGDVNKCKNETFNELLVYAEMAGDFSCQEKYDKAITYFEKCLPLAEKIRPQYNRENLVNIHSYLSRMYELRNSGASDQQKAQEHLAKIQEIRSVPDTDLADVFVANHNKMVDTLKAIIAENPNGQEAADRVFGPGGLFKL